ncbi:cytochrome P450 [Altererythrobacter sp. H2]|uniref:cytochrome P450 n=1 Tax=Altererythrobacter sp. H2 TaxID=3108391 RepID=UPI002B4BEFD9|nr:cytochrome P450 [Altererythrobacter sp. H2]WRK95191.1 cytochrome P450 [Altererythrobacter sp. H2]
MTRPTTTIDAFSPEVYADDGEIAARLAAMRGQGDVLWIEQDPYRPFWAVLRHANVMEVERNNKVWLNEPRLTLLPSWFEDRTIAQFGNRTGPVRTLLDMDEPDHRKHRQLTQSWFNSKYLDTLRERMRLLAKDYVDRIETLAASGPFDFVEEVAVPYPLIMITTILGLPDSDAPLVLRLTQELFGASDPERNANGDFGLATAMEFFGYLGGVVQQRRNAPLDDLMSVIATATIDGAPLSDMETLSYGMLLAAAGHDTTSSSVGVGMMQLARNPAEFAKLRANPALVAPAAQEMFRWATPVRHFLRTAAVDTELAGQPVKAGEHVALMYLSANRDERAFDAPDEFRIDRSPNRHLAFGYGAHHCLGRILAEMEVEALFAEIAARVDTIELAGEPEWVKTNHTGGLKHLPVRVRMK